MIFLNSDYLSLFLLTLGASGDGPYHLVGPDHRPEVKAVVVLLGDHKSAPRGELVDLGNVVVAIP